jgi:glutathione S-transferase
LSDIILHHYPPSPVSEKIRVVLGIKNLDWHSVIIPRLPPKPDLMPLTGGYRLTPVMQIGADIYCDSQCIARELDRRFPQPTLFPGGAQGMAWGVGKWTDGALFNAVVSLVFADAGDDMPDDFKADRGPLYFGPDFNMAALQEKMVETLVQLRAQFGWMDERLAGRDYMLGAEPGLPDALAYYLVWFIRGRYSKGPEFLSQFNHLMAWEHRVQALGHGNSVEMDAADALAIAKAATPDAPPPSAPDPFEPTGLVPGDSAAVEATEVSGCPAVTGRIELINAQEIALARTDKTVGEVVVHFPRAGYRTTKI